MRVDGKSFGEDSVLIAHVADLMARAEAGGAQQTAFLTPREQRSLLSAFPALSRVSSFCGGYGEAERKRLILYPPYLCESEEPWCAEQREELDREAVVALRVCGSGYRDLTHRDFLGAVLHLGVKREAIGDLCVLGTDRAILFCDRLIATFLKENLLRVANDAVTLCEEALPPDFNGGRRYEEMTDTVASPRLDAVVAALCRLSRERAQALLASEQVELDYEITAKCDREVVAGSIITVHGFGKFRIRALDERTKKGRLRLRADRYV